MKLRDAPIQRKLMIVIMMNCLTVLILMVTAYAVLEFFSFRNVARDHVATLGGVIASNSSAALAFDSPRDAEEILAALKANPHIVSACLYDKEGRLFAWYPAKLDSSAFPAIPSGEGYDFAGEYITGFAPVMQKDQKLGMLYIKSDLEEMYARLQQYGLIALLLIIGSMFIAYVLSRTLQKSISEPILQLEQTARRISEQHDYSVRASQYGKDEVGAFTSAFNQMLSQIQLQNNEITSLNQNLELKVEVRTQALQQQMEFVDTIINSSVDLVAVFDKHLNYMMLNKRASHYYNISREFVIGRNILEIFPNLENTSMIHNLQKALQGQPVHDTLYRSPVLNMTFENYYIPLKDKDNKIYGVLTIGHDMTGILEAQENLEKLNSELVKSNRDLEQFAYVASHDLQEPLRKIQTFAELMAAQAGNDARLHTFQQKIAQSARRMQHLIQDVLVFSRISKAEDAFEQTDLNNVLDHLKSDFELLIREKQAIINHPQMPVIRGIPLQLSQLFSNIISNSLKYNTNKPVIDIRYKPLSEEDILQYPRLNANLHYIKFEISDNGIGFEQHYSEKIFDIFQRLHGRQSYSGTGIGLTICKKIVENHHGIIYADGKPNEGATFTWILPA